MFGSKVEFVVKEASVGCKPTSIYSLHWGKENSWDCWIRLVKLGLMLVQFKACLRIANGGNFSVSNNSITTSLLFYGSWIFYWLALAAIVAEVLSATEHDGSKSCVEEYDVSHFPINLTRKERLITNKVKFFSFIKKHTDCT